MRRYLRSVIMLLTVTALFSACNRMPDHTRYIPKDAIAVAGINLKALGKKIAWNVITGSKLFKEMQERIPAKNAKDAISGIEKAGIDAMNTFYVYVKADNRFKGGNRITGLIPLSDAGQWEAYVKQSFPKAEIKQHGDRKEASLGRDLYVGWNKNLLILINVLSVSADTSGEAERGGVPSGVNVASTMGQADITAEMDNAFGVTKDNSLISNKHFMTLTDEGHDISFWLNYDQIMTQYSGDMADKVGLALSNELWKDVAFTSGIDFKKGKITADMRYYTSAEMQDVGREFAASKADKDMIDRLPVNNMDMLMAMHISPKGIKDLLDKTKLLGLVNVALAQSNMNIDNILDAFTGDMAIVMNDFSLQVENVTDSFMGTQVTRQIQKPSMALSYIIKINKKENFQKLLQMAKANGLQPMGSGFVMPITTTDSVYLITNDQYAVISNKIDYANSYLSGGFKGQKMPEVASAQAYGNPMSMYLDMQQFGKNIDMSIAPTPHDSAMLAESKKLLNNISFYGGGFEKNAFEFHLDINFTNQDENSIIALMDYAMKMNDADKLIDTTRHPL